MGDEDTETTVINSLSDPRSILLTVIKDQLPPQDITTSQINTMVKNMYIHIGIYVCILYII